MKQSNNREKNIQSYQNNKYMIIETDRRKIIESHFLFIVIFLLCVLFNIILEIEFKRFDVIILLAFIGIGLIDFLIIKYDNWKLKLENNTIYIERKIFPSYSINVDDVIKIQYIIYRNTRKIYREYVEIAYFNNKNKIKMDRLYIFKNINYFADKDKMKEFIKIISNQLDNKKDYNSDVEDIMGREEKVEKFYKRSTFIKKMKSPINSFYNKVFFMIRIGYFRHRYFICNS